VCRSSRDAATAAVRRRVGGVVDGLEHDSGQGRGGADCSLNELDADRRYASELGVELSEAKAEGYLQGHRVEHELLNDRFTGAS